MVHERGIHADAFQPEFCRIHDGKCYTLRKYAVMTMNDFQHVDSVELKPTEPAKWTDVMTSNEVIKWSIILIILAILIVRRRTIVGAFLSILRSVKFISIR